MYFSLNIFLIAFGLCYKYTILVCIPRGGTSAFEVYSCRAPLVNGRCILTIHFKSDWCSKKCGAMHILNNTRGGRVVWFGGIICYIGGGGSSQGLCN